MSGASQVQRLNSILILLDISAFVNLQDIDETPRDVVFFLLFNFISLAGGHGHRPIKSVVSAPTATKKLGYTRGWRVVN